MTKPSHVFAFGLAALLFASAFNPTGFARDGLISGQWHTGAPPHGATSLGLSIAHQGNQALERIYAENRAALADVPPLPDPPQRE